MTNSVQYCKGYEDGFVAENTHYYISRSTIKSTQTKVQGERVSANIAANRRF
jgi:hypothetical protein